MGEYYIYIHTNKVNGKKYIGQTCQKPEYRWNNGKKYEHNEYFYRAIQKYGWENFEHEIIAENLTQEEANHLEELLIKEYDTTNRDKGYNIMLGGNNHRHTEETKKKMSETRTGKKHTKEWCENISSSLRGRKDITEAAIKAHKKRVRCIETNTVYDSQVEAEKETGISRKRISACLNGRQKTAGDYHWELFEGVA